MEETLRVAQHLISYETNGPGRRFVIWLQGCTLQCPGCFNAEFQDPLGGTPYQLKELQCLIAAAGELQGITLSGGEPLLQAQRLLPLMRWVKKVGLSIVCYTGFELEAVQELNLPFTKELVELCDILIDGHFDEAQKEPLLWRGSRNQQVHFLSNRYRDNYSSLINEKQKWRSEIVVSDGIIAMTGIFEQDVWELLVKKVVSRRQ